MKYYIYFGSEENAYEIEKFGPFPTMDKVLEQFDTNERGELNEEKFKETVEKDGFDYFGVVNEHGYNTVIGVAKQRFCRNIRAILNDCRKEIIAFF